MKFLQKIINTVDKLKRYLKPENLTIKNRKRTIKPRPHQIKNLKMIFVELNQQKEIDALIQTEPPTLLLNHYHAKPHNTRQLSGEQFFYDKMEGSLNKRKTKPFSTKSKR